MVAILPLTAPTTGGWLATGFLEQVSNSVILAFTVVKRVHVLQESLLLKKENE